MSALRRQELLRILGIDQYQRRSIAKKAAVAEESPAEEQASPLPDSAPKDVVAEPKPEVTLAPKAKKPEAQKPNPETPVQKPLKLLWWQHEDLLFIEEFSSQAALPDLARLTQNIASALGRSTGLDGELHWPPGGDFNAISQNDFLVHFVRGRSEAIDSIKLLVTGDFLDETVEELGDTYRIDSLSAMLTDPSLKPQTWQTLKVLRR